jgi:cytochrome P450
MDFQDTLEDVTAKVVVVPRWLSLVAMLWPLQRRRERLQLVIQKRLEGLLQQMGNDTNDVGDGREIGFWLEAVLSKKIPVSDIAEYIVGLLFAGHKNPAIGAAQSYLLLREYGSEQVQANCLEEAATLVSTDTPIKWSQFKSSLPTLRRACLESLRLTAHSIGGVRTAQKDLTVSVHMDNAGKETIYTIPKGSSVGFSHITSSLDASIWGKDSRVFDSDLRRHSEESYTDDYKFTTFSHGVHKCPGRELAMIHLETTVALLLTEYEVGLPDKIPSLDFERATLAQREEPVMVSIEKRQH